MLLAGCEQLRSLPDGPTAPAGPSRWSTVFPEHPSPDIDMVLALDPDDVWVGGEQGLLQHFDGEQVTWHRLPDPYSVDALGGLAWDQVWCLANERLYRWDGRQWSFWHRFTELRSLDSLWGDGPDDILVGGRSRNGLPALARWDGFAWKTSYFGHRDGKVRQIWRPGPDMPLLAWVGFHNQPYDTLYQDTGEDGWRPVPLPGVPAAAHGTLVAVVDPEATSVATLYRFMRGGDLQLWCQAFPRQGTLTDGVRPLIFHGGVIGSMYGCWIQDIGHYDRFNLDTLVPVLRHGAQPHCLVGLTWDDDLVRITWPADDAVDVEVLATMPRIRPYRNLVGDGQRLFCITLDDQLAVGLGQQWSLVSRPEARFKSLAMQPDGHLLAVYRDDDWEPFIGRHAPDGTWTWYPDAGVGTPRGCWYDAGQDVLHLASEDGNVTAFRAGAWHRSDDLGLPCDFYGAISAQQQYAVVRDRERRHHVLRFDGHAWRDITPPQMARTVSAVVAPRRGELLIASSSWIPEHGQRTRLQRHDGEQWSDEAVVDDWLNLPGLQELGDGSLIIRDHGFISLLHAHGLKHIMSWSDPDYPGSPFPDTGIWVDDDHGLYILDDMHQIHHRPGTAP
jgi:hypothetical protein